MFSGYQHVYKPVQPSVNESCSDVVYTEFKPVAALRELIFCYWELKTKQLLSSDFQYRVAADGCTDLFFELDHPDEIYISGFTPAATVFNTGKNFHYFGIRFFPSAFTLFSGIPALSLSNRCERLSDVYSQLHEQLLLITNLSLTNLPDAANNVFLKLAGNRKANPDYRFYNALDLILRSNGNLAVETELNTGVSGRQLRRMFLHHIGDTPKTFSKLVRFQHLLRSCESLSTLRRSKLYFDSGYFDQAHFIREFKTFYGLTPTQAAE